MGAGRATSPPGAWFSHRTRTRFLRLPPVSEGACARAWAVRSPNNPLLRLFNEEHVSNFLSSSAPNNRDGARSGVAGDEAAIAAQRHALESRGPDFSVEISGVDVANRKLAFKCTLHHARQFAALRHRYCEGEQQFVLSLARSRIVKLDGGHTHGKGFHQTLDERYIIKHIKKAELEGFSEFSVEYFGYMSRVLYEKTMSCLVKLLGVRKPSPSRLI